MLASSNTHPVLLVRLCSGLFLLPHILDLRVEILQLDWHTGQAYEHLNHSPGRFKVRIGSRRCSEESCALEASLASNPEDYPCCTCNCSSFCQFGAHLLQSFTDVRIAHDAVNCSNI